MVVDEREFEEEMVWRIGALSTYSREELLVCAFQFMHLGNEGGGEQD